MQDKVQHLVSVRSENNYISVTPFAAPPDVSVYFRSFLVQRDCILSFFFFNLDIIPDKLLGFSNFKIIKKN